MSDMYNIMYSLGRSDALKLNADAHAMTGTQIIASEHCIPKFNSEKDYTAWPAGAPVSDDGQVWTLIQPHNAKNYEGRPATLRALWGLAHTTDPNKAKHWVDPFGTSGMYLRDECYKDAESIIHRCIVEQTNFDAVALPDAWETVILDAES